MGETAYTECKRLYICSVKRKACHKNIILPPPCTHKLRMVQPWGLVAAVNPTCDMPFTSARDMPGNTATLIAQY